MARKLKTYQTSLGFFDLAIAAPSMKAALQAWGSNSNLFHQGLAREIDDAEIVSAAMAKPGVVLKRPVGSGGRFTEHPDLPDELPRERSAPAKKAARSARPAKDPDKASRAFAQQQKKREAARLKAEAAEARDRERRERAIDKAKAAIHAAQQQHDSEIRAIEAERSALDDRLCEQEARWAVQKKKLEGALQRARD